MRKDQCFYCTSRKCNTRIVSTIDNGKTYDEVACIKHSADLHKHSDDVAPKVMKLFISSTGSLKRGEDISSNLKELNSQYKNVAHCGHFEKNTKMGVLINDIRK